jgi:inorganic triphosphatase YgiF
MADQDAFKAAEQRGYRKGYAAGQRKKAKALAVDRRRAQERAFEQRAFLAVLPWVFEQQRWGRKDSKGVHTPFSTKADLVAFAWSLADEALEQGVNKGVFDV